MNTFSFSVINFGFVYKFNVNKIFRYLNYYVKLYFITNDHDIYKILSGKYDMNASPNFHVDVNASRGNQLKLIKGTPVV